MPVPGLSLLGLQRIRGFVSILRYINPTIIIIIISLVYIEDFYLTFSQWAEFCTVWNQFEAGGLVYEKLIFSKGHQKVIFAGEDYKKFKKILSRISRGLKKSSCDFFGETWGGWTIELVKVMKIGGISLSHENFLKVVAICHKSEKGVYYLG